MVEEHIHVEQAQEDEHIDKESKIPGAKKKNTFLMLLLGLGIALFIGIGIVYGIAVQGVKTQSTTPFVLTVARVFQMPVAVVNGDRVLYTQYVDNLKAMNQFYVVMKDDGQIPEDQLPTDEQMKDGVLSRLLVNKLIDQISKEYSVTVSEDEVSSALDEQLVSQFESKEKAQEEINRLHGWTLDHYVDEVIRPAILEEKLAAAYLETQSASDEEKEEIKSKAQEVLEQVKGGASFEELAAEYGSDGTATQGGDLGWFGKGVMVPAFEQAIFELEPGTLRDELVETEFGYHIVRLDEKRTVTDETTGEKKEEAKARHILFQLPQADVAVYRDFMTGRLSEAIVKLSEGIHNPLEDFLKQNGVQ